MKKMWILLLALLLLCGCQRQENVEPTPPTVAVQTVPEETTLSEIIQSAPPASDDTFVRVLDYIPTAFQEIRYATEDNFTGTVIYDFEDAYLRWGTVKKLQLVCADLEELGFYIKIWDGFRPPAAQFALWEACPDSTYVADPNKGYSSHSRGNTIDLTLVDENGVEVEMPTDFDDFSLKADRDYADCTQIAANNAQILEILMEKHGFQGYSGEWWHYSDSTAYPVESVFEPN